MFTCLATFHLVTDASFVLFVQVKVGDTLDLILSENQDSVTLMRVVLRGVVGESSRTEKQKVSLRRWKFKELPREDVYKS